MECFLPKNDICNFFPKMENLHFQGIKEMHLCFFQKKKKKEKETCIYYGFLIQIVRAHTIKLRATM